MALNLKKGDLVRSILNDGPIYRVEANKNGWLTVRVARDPLNADLVYTKQRASLFVRLELDKRLTPTTVLQFTPRTLSECQGTLNYWVRLADTATGETQPEWTLVYSAEALDDYAARYGVPLVKAPEGA